MSNENIYVNAVRESNSGYDVYISGNRVIRNVNRNIVEKMFGNGDLEYLLSVPTNGKECFSPLDDHELKDLKKYNDS
jgi:hypothetical protein